MIDSSNLETREHVSQSHNYSSIDSLIVTNPSQYIETLSSPLPDPIVRAPDMSPEQKAELVRIKLDQISNRLKTLSSKPDPMPDDNPPSVKRPSYMLETPRTDEWLREINKSIYRRTGQEIHRAFFGHLRETINKGHSMDDLEPVLATFEGEPWEGIHPGIRDQLTDVVSELSHEMQLTIEERTDQLAKSINVPLRAFVIPNFFAPTENKDPRFVDGLVFYCQKEDSADFEWILEKYYLAKEKFGSTQANDGLLKFLSSQIDNLWIDIFELKTFLADDPKRRGNVRKHDIQVEGYRKNLIAKMLPSCPVALRPILEHHVSGFITNIEIQAIDKNHTMLDIQDPHLGLRKVN